MRWRTLRPISGLAVQMGRQDAEHVFAADPVDMPVAEDGVHVLVHRREPVLRSLGVPPPRPVRVEGALAGLPEGRGLRPPLVGERVASVGDGAAVGEGAVTGHGERDDRPAAQADVASYAVDGDSLDPGLGPARRNDEVQRPAVAVAARDGQGPHLPDRQLPQVRILFSHRDRGLSIPRIIPLRVGERGGTGRNGATCRVPKTAAIQAMFRDSRERRRRENGAPCRIRTCGLLVRSQTLYPAELRARSCGDRNRNYTGQTPPPSASAPAVGGAGPRQPRPDDRVSGPELAAASTRARPGGPRRG